MKNLFEILGVASDFSLSIETLEPAYLAAQRRWHPDRFVGKPVAERMEAMQASADVNAAYRALKDPLTRAQHLLEIQGIRVNGERDTVKPSHALLMEMMERREALSETADPAARADLARQVSGEEAECATALTEAFANADYGQATQLTLRLRYLRALSEEASRPAAIATL